MSLSSASAAAPSGNVVDVSRSGDQRIDGILSGARWVGPITFGNPASPDSYGAGYPEALTNFQQVNATQLAAVRAALTGAPGYFGFSVADFTNLSISYGGTGVSNVRVADTGDPATAYSYEPQSGRTAGDVFFGAAGRRPVTGNYDAFTIIHELGHALGLKHGNEGGGFGALPEATDSMEFSAMTYRSYVGSDALYVYNEAWSYAQSYMMYDIAALQRLYGADFTANAGNTTYTWSPRTGDTFVDGVLAIDPGANRIFETVWDGNGIDTYNLSNYATDLAINLNPGSYSTFSAAQRADLGGGPNGGFARGNVFNALLYESDARSLIENAIGGTGDDRIVGNQAANRLTGNGGNDALFGGVGNDILNGGVGADRMDGGSGNDTYVVDVRGDTITEALGGPSGGVDRVVSAVSRALGPNVESLVLTGTAALAGTGNTLANALGGNAAANTLRGLAGNDTLIGGDGPDILIGGRGGDVFRFSAASQSTPASPDTIRAGDGALAFENPGAGAGDRIDLSRIDADLVHAGDQDFVLGGDHRIGHLWIVESGGDTNVRGNVAGGLWPEFEVVIEDGATPATAYTAADFIGLA